jgi:hypothetical protein
MEGEPSMSDDILDNLLDNADEAADQEYWNFEEKPLIKGILIGADVAPGREYGPYFVLRIKEAATDDVFGIPVWGTVFNNKVADLAPKVGSPIAVRFDGEKSNKEGSRTYKAWTVVAPDSDYEFWHDMTALKLKRARPAITPTSGSTDGDYESFF